MTTEHDNQPEATQEDKTTAGGWIFGAIVSIFAVGFFLVLPLYALLDYLGERRIDHVEPGGTLVAVHPVGSWNPDSLIETTTGFYTVDGSVALVKGIQFRLETRNNGAKFLCNQNGAYCSRIIGWGLEDGPQKPAAAAASSAGGAK